jgi:RNA polymerase sigma factor (sigma-70 family)
VAELDQAAAAQAAVSPMSRTRPSVAPAGFEEFFRSSFRELVRAAMYAGATAEDGQDAASKTLADMLQRWDTCGPSLAYARKATVHNFIKAKTRGINRVARRLVERGHVPGHEGDEDRQLTAWEDEEWVAAVLSTLPPAQREVMELIVEGFDRDEIAEAVGKTREAVRRNLSDARARLSRELNQDGSLKQRSPATGLRKLTSPPDRPQHDPAKVSFWNSLGADQKRAFRAKAHERVFAAGARLMQEGEHGDHVAVILSGETEIRAGEHGAERVVAVRGPGQLIGKRAALEVNPRSATVVARQTVMALVVSTADFAAFISTYPAVLKIVEEQIFTRLSEARADQDLPGGQLAFTPARIRPADLGQFRLTGQNCTVIRSDVVEFGAVDRDAEARKIVKRTLPAMTEQALGPIWSACRCEDRGDGLLVVVSPEIPTAQVIDRLVTTLPPQLRRHNRTYSTASRMQLRVAVEVGPIEDTEFGVTGPSIAGVSRLLDAPAFKRAIKAQEGVLGLIVSPFVYTTCIRPGGSLLDPAGFTEVPVGVKETRRSAWMQVTG